MKVNKKILGSILLLSYLGSSWSIAEDYRWQFQGTFPFYSSSAAESCQSFFNWTRDNFKKEQPDWVVRLYNFRFVKPSWAPQGSAFHCMFDLELPHGTFPNQRGQVNRLGDSCPNGKVFNSNKGFCEEFTTSCKTNPVINGEVSLLTGGQNLQYTDFEYDGLEIVRSFNVSGQESNWSFSFQESLRPMEIENDQVYIHRNMGKESYLEEVSPQCWRSPGSPCYQIEVDGDIHTLVSSNQKKQFDDQGRIQKKSNLTGEEVTNYVYLADAIQIEKNNHSIDVQLDSENKVVSISNGTDSVTYLYADNSMIEHVIGVDQRDDYFIYDDANNGLLVESGVDGVPFSRWAFDLSNRVTSSEHAGGVDRYTFVYLDDGVEVTNQLNKKTIYRFTEISGVNRLAEVEGLETPNCIGATRGFTYYPDGNVASESDNKGNTTSYQYNTRNLESSRTEALGTPQERTITTEWHPTFNLRTKITEPGRETNFIYDAEGRLLSHSSNDLPLS